METKPKLLVLDDQSEYVRSLARALRAEFEVIGAASVPEAQARLYPDIGIALVDVRLNEADAADRQGLEFLRWLRSNRAKVRAICMSALDDPALPDQAKADGAVAFLAKPLKMSELKQQLALLTGHQA